MRATRNSRGHRAPKRAFGLVAVLCVTSCTFGRAAAPAPDGAPGLLSGEPPAGIEPIVDSLRVPEGVLLDTIRSVPLDYGKLWAFEEPPTDHLREAHGFVPDSTWLNRLRLAVLRIPGCSASLVSADGLLLTNHHCSRDALEQASGAGEDLLRDGFRAASLADERPIEGLYADQLLAIEDVSEEVESRLAMAPASLRFERREEIHADIRDRFADRHGGAEDVVVEVVSLYGGARTSAYVYRRHEDVRLVMAPELEVGFFGGDPDNFTYPRHTLDFAFFRIYGGDGEPLTSDAHLRWSTAGPREGEAVFSAGNPGSTHRFETLTQLAFRHDVSDRALLDFVRRRAAIFEAFVRERPELAHTSGVESALFELQNSVRSYEGQLAGLSDPVIVSRLRDREATLRREIEADSLLTARFEGLFERIAELQTRKRRNAAGYTFVALGSTEYESATLRRALIAYQYANALRQALPIRTRSLILDQILMVPNRPAELEEALIQDRLQGFVDAFGAESQLVLDALEGRSPEGAATYIRENSLFSDSSRAAEVMRSGAIPMEDPALRVVLAYLPALGRFEQLRVQTDAQEQVLSNEVERAHFAVHGTGIPPEATFSPRFSDGVVRGYASGGSDVQPFTTLRGMFERHDANRAAASPWDLPARWLDRRDELDLDTPLNFASTLDIVGGSSGSPVVDRELRLVGVVFDGNRESLPGSYIYLAERSRAVSVDARAILEALRVVHGMEALVAELSSGQLPSGVGTGAPR